MLAFLRVIGLFLAIAFISARFAARSSSQSSRSGLSSSSRNACAARVCVSSIPGTYYGTVDEWLTTRRSTAGIARVIHAPAAAADFPAGQRGDLWATGQHIVGTVTRWFYSSALDGTTPWAEFIRSSL